MNKMSIFQSLSKEMKKEERNFEDVNYAHYLDEVEEEPMYIAHLVLVSLVYVLIRALKNFTQINDDCLLNNLLLRNKI